MKILGIPCQMEMRLAIIPRLLEEFTSSISTGKNVFTPILKEKASWLSQRDLDPEDSFENELLNALHEVIDVDEIIKWDQVILPKYTVLKVKPEGQNQIGSFSMQKETPNGICLRDFMSFYSILAPIYFETWWEFCEDSISFEENENVLIMHFIARNDEYAQNFHARLNVNRKEGDPVNEVYDPEKTRIVPPIPAPEHCLGRIAPLPYPVGTGSSSGEGVPVMRTMSVNPQTYYLEYSNERR